MRILFVADLHYALKQFDWVAAHAQEYDLVILGGDLLDLSSPLELDVQIVVVEKYLERIGRGTLALVCSGNHDGDQRSAENESIAGWLQDARSARVLVDGDSYQRNGILMTVCPWWDGPSSRAAVEAQLARDAAQSKSRWVWIHHAPPDRSPVSWTGKKFGGDEYLVEWIRKYEPDLVLSGHIHNAPFYSAGSWIDRLGKTWVLNPGRQIGPCPTHIALDLDAMSAEWISLEGQVLRHLNAPDTGAVTSSPSAVGGA
ncbi:MAG TPA: metallophosphoesterase [Verrucomicrobiota bacterium]|nr:metallophosphoesterase [Verrucomicrobiota bacterium]